MTTPRTAAGRALLDARGYHGTWTQQRWIEAIVAIEAEASASPASPLDAAWKAVEDALPEGWRTRLGSEVEDGLSWWATAESQFDGQSLTLVSTSVKGVLYGSPTEALNALAAVLRGDVK